MERKRLHDPTITSVLLQANCCEHFVDSLAHIRAHGQDSACPQRQKDALDNCHPDQDKIVEFSDQQLANKNAKALHFILGFALKQGASEVAYYHSLLMSDYSLVCEIPLS
eukprot:TRINITY_DN459_c0_g2_i1.p2 TRINITY_DN459_c0_g2~~TRINITY_DN459_c0_g2_i1.p2  ORF type:complete len:110 (+),score=12.20 TRINITY_DN459_c0_g2_i1:1508-1837(+)